MNVFRPLGPSERTLERVSRACPQNFATVVEVRGPLDADRLAAATPALLRRHPLLRATVQKLDGALTFVDAGITALDVPTDPRPWVAVVEDEIAFRFAPDRGPLVRIVWCPAQPDEPIDGRLLLTLHHTIGDGKSGVFATRDLLQAVAGEDLAALPLRPDVDTLQPPIARGLGGHLRRLRFGGRMSWADARDGKPTNPRYDEDASPETRVARVFPIAWDAERTRALAKRCRAERTTVHGALLGAQVLANVADLGVDQAVSVLAGSPVDLRPHLVPPVHEELMLTVSMLAYRGKVCATTPFWDVARAIRRSIERAQAQNEHLVSLGALPLLMKLVGPERSDAAFSRRWAELLPNTCGLTNLGRLDLPTHIGDVELVASQFVVNPSIFGASVATATSTHGALRWNHSYGEPTIAWEHGQALADDAERRVLEAIG